MQRILNFRRVIASVVVYLKAGTITHHAITRRAITPHRQRRSDERASEVDAVIGRQMGMEVGSTVSTAAGTSSVQVVALVPIRELLGARWEALSGTVRTTFANAVARVQTAGDTCSEVAEVTYLLSFRNMTPTMSALACGAVARDVCTHLFGEQYTEALLRRMLVTAPEQDLASLSNSMLRPSSQLESAPPGSERSAVDDPTASAQFRPESSPIAKMHGLAESLGIRLGFVPSWHLRKRTSSSLHLVPLNSHRPELGTAVSQLGTLSSQDRVRLEVEMLRAAAAYGSRLHDAGRVCSVGVGVSYESMIAQGSRNRYLAELQTLHIPSDVPLLVKIERVPDGAPLNRIAEFSAMIRRASILVAVEFETITALPNLDTPIQAIGFGGPLSAACDCETAARLAKKLVQRTTSQRAFAFLDRLETPDLVRTAELCGIKFATGSAFGRMHLSGDEAIPTIPLEPRTLWWNTAGRQNESPAGTR